MYFYMEEGQERCFKDEVVKNFVSISRLNRLLNLCDVYRPWKWQSTCSTKMLPRFSKTRWYSMWTEFCSRFIIQKAMDCMEVSSGQTNSTSMMLRKEGNTRSALSLLIQCSKRLATSKSKQKSNLTAISIEQPMLRNRIRRPSTKLKKNEKYKKKRIWMHWHTVTSSQ